MVLRFFLNLASCARASGMALKRGNPLRQIYFYPSQPSQKKKRIEKTKSFSVMVEKNEPSQPSRTITPGVA